MAKTHDESTSRTTTSLSKETGLIAGVTVSLTVVMVIIVVILALVFKKIHLRKQLLSRPLGNGKRTSELNFYATENVQEDQYHDIDISDGDYCLAAAVTGDNDRTEDTESTYARAISGVYDKLNEKDRKIPTKNENENVPKLDGSKSGIYTVTSNQTVNKKIKENNSSTKWKTPDDVDIDPTYNHLNNVIVREDLSNYDHFSNQYSVHRLY